MPSLDDPIATWPGIGPKRAELLANLGIGTLRDLVLHLPRAYEDRRSFTAIADCRVGETATVEAEVISSRNVRLRGRMSMAVVKLRDDSGEMTATFFGRGFLAQSTFKKGARGVFTGPVETYNGLALKNPEYEMIEEGDDARLHSGRIVPIYRLTEGLGQRFLRRLIHDVLDALTPRDPGKTRADQPPVAPGEICMGTTSMGATGMGATGMGATSMGATSMGATSMGATSMGATSMGATGGSPASVRDDPEVLPESLRIAHHFPPFWEALRAVHFPESLEAADRARTRFAYEELFTMQLVVLRERVARLHEEQGIAHTINGEVLRGLGRALPFALTGAQERSISAILRDMASPRPMCRLLQGDVGCGKTIVALHAIAAAVDGGHQAAIMAPTEILAEQHFRQFRTLLQPLGIQVELLSSAMRGAKHIRQRLASGFAQVAVGTHALVQEATTFHQLGLVVIDEQHRFGVMQRATLAGKGVYPDVLHMTATPIPRTLAISLYGGMDISIIDELPPGRLPVKTRHIVPDKTEAMYQYILEQVQEGAQAYVICPLIEESETRQLTSVLNHFEELSAGPLAGARTGVLHGRLDASEKDTLMDAFKAGTIQVLFSTTVVEVGVDVPSATIMVIEDAGQFGLTQLHQLRGRVGRGPAQSYCFLAGTAKTREAKQRLDALCKFTSGFDIAEEDLKLRGPGEFFGERQAGLSDLRAADLLRDVRLLEQARADAEALLEADPHLKEPAHAALHARVMVQGKLQA